MPDFQSVLDTIISQNRACYFFSPHLDDAVLSCGNTLLYLTGKTPVTVATVFTQPSPKPYTFSARRFLTKCGENSADTLFEKRRNEDMRVLKKIGVRVEHCNEVDGTWRRKNKLSKISGMLSRFIPELLYRYPTFLNVISGKLMTEDYGLIDDLERAIKKSLPKDAVLFAPLAIGNHIDHVLVRELFSRFPGTIFWSDFPYNLKSQPDKIFLKKKKLQEYSFQSKSRKNDAINGYTSQTPTLFPDGKIPEKNEIYYQSTSL